MFLFKLTLTLTLTLILIICLFTPAEQRQLGGGGQSLKDWSSWTAPLDPQFYIAQPVKLKIQSNGGDFNFISAKDANPQAPTEYEYVTEDADLAIIPNLPFTPMSFVGGIKDSMLMILAPNRYKLIDFIELNQYKDVKIKVSDGFTAQIMKDIVSYYKLEANVSEISITAANPMIYASLVSSHPDKNMANIIMNNPMHLVTVGRINGGNYFIGPDEIDFFKQHPYYFKSNYDILDKGAKYQGLTRNGSAIYHPTISIRLALYAKDTVNPDIVTRILKAIIKQKQLSNVDISNDRTKGLMHPGAIKVYKLLNLHTDRPLSPSFY